MGSFIQDIRYGLKLLWKEKAFTLAALLTLAVCIGANTSLFSVIDAVLLEPYRFEEPDRLALVFNAYPMAVGSADIGANASGDYFFRREGIEAFEEIGLYQNGSSTVGDPGSTEQMRSLRITPSLLPTLRVQPVLGRGFTDDEMDPGNGQKVILSHGFWQERYAGDPVVLGRELRVDGEPYTVVGVMPEDFVFLGQSEFRIVLPIVIPEEARGLDSLHNNNFQMIARLAPGATLEQARSQIDALNETLTEQSPLPNAKQILEDAGFMTRVEDLKGFLLRDIRPTFMMLWAGVGLVLLIGCVNIANLMMARSNVRMRELATRFALGAGRGRLSAQMVTESLVIATIGGLLGLGAGALGLRLLETLGANELPRGSLIGIDGEALLFTLGIAVLAGLIFGIVPLFHVFRSDLKTLLHQESRGGTSDQRTMLVRSGLVVLQISLAFVLLIGAGLMFTSFRNVLQVDPGFEPDPVLTGYVRLPGSRYPDAASRVGFTDRFLERVRALPGVTAASVTNQVPFSGDNSASAIFPVDHEMEEGESILAPVTNVVGPEYFEALGIPLLAGRPLEESDTDDTENVIVIDEWLAERYWPETGALGRQMSRGVPGMEPDPDQIFTVVGVVGSIRQNTLEGGWTPVGAYYHTYKQTGLGFLTVVVRTAVEPTSVTSAVRGALSGIDPDLPFFGVETLRERIDDSLRSRRSAMILLLVFSGVALFLAAVGIYGVLAYAVTQRTREFGVRMALGATSDRIFRMIVGHGLKVLGIGLAVGIGAALGLVQLVRSLLYGVAPTDPVVLGVVVLVLAAVVVFACVLPARRAIRIDPVVALNR
jgi:predicted permease